jgi:aryl-alcohol dehydrogenase
MNPLTVTISLAAISRVAEPMAPRPFPRAKKVFMATSSEQWSFANYALCTERNMVKVPNDAPLERLGPLACGIQTGAGAVINSLKVGVGKSFAAFGTGSVGLAAIMAARVAGATTIIGVDLNSKRLGFARELGTTHTINGAQENVVDSIMRITGAGVHYALDTTASPKVIRQAVDSLTLRGQCGLVGASTPGSEICLDVMHLMTAGRKVRGIVEGDSAPDIFVPQLIELQKQGRFPYDRMLEFYDLENINQAIADSESGAAVKPVVRMAQD